MAPSRAPSARLRSSGRRSWLTVPSLVSVVVLLQRTTGTLLPPGGPDKPSPEYGWVREMLGNATIRLGNQSIAVVDINLTNITCAGVHLGPINSSVTTVRDGGIALGLSNITTHCAAGWQHHNPFENATKSGPFAVDVRVLNVTADIELSKNASNELISAVRVVACGADVALNVSFGAAEGWIEKKVVQYLESHITHLVNATICGAVEKVVAIDLGGAIANLSAAIAPFMAPVTPAPASPVPDPTDVVDLRTTPLVELLEYATTTGIGPGGVNALLNAVFPSGVVQPADTRGINRTISVGNATAIVGVTSLNLTGFDTFQTLSTVDAVGPHTLRAAIGIAWVEMTATGYVEVNPGGRGFNASSSAVQWFSATLRVDNVSLTTLTELVVRRSRMAALNHQWFSESGAASCFASTLQAWNSTLVKVDAVVASITSVRVSGGNVDRDVDGVLEAVITLALMSMRPVLPNVLRGLVNGPGRAVINDARASHIAYATCSPTPSLADTTSTQIITATVTCIVAVAVAFLAVRAASQRRRDAILGAAQTSEGGIDTAGNDHQDVDCAAAHIINNVSALPPLASSNVPLPLRMSIIVLLVATAGVFALGTASRGSGVYLVLDVEGQPAAQGPPLHYLSLVGSVRDAWQAGDYPQSIFIGASNVAGPMVRVLMLAVVCSAPALSHARRVRIASVANFLGRFVFAQAFLLSLMVLAFRFNLIDTHSKAPATASAHVFIIPDWWAWWGIVACTALGIAASNVILVVLNKMRPHAPLLIKASGTSASSRSFATSDNENVGRRVTTGFVPTLAGGRAGSAATASSSPSPSLPESVGVVAVLVIAVVAVVYGSTMPAFVFHFEGVAGFLANASGSRASQEYSFWSSIVSLPSHRIGHPAGVAFVQVFKVLTAFVLPVLQGIAALVLWCTPLRSEQRRRAAMALQILSSWAALDVLSLATVVAFMQIGMLADFIVGHRCDALSPLLHRPNVTKLLDGDPKCLDVSVTLLSGIAVVGVAAVAIHVVTVRVTRRAFAASRRDERWGIDAAYPLYKSQLELSHARIAEGATARSSEDNVALLTDRIN